MFRQIKRLALVVWEHGGVWKLWAFATGIAAFSKHIDEWTGFRLQSALPEWVPAPAWWWGLVVLALWIIFSLARRVLRYETPALELATVLDPRDSSWWLEVHNRGGKVLNSCAVDFERIETTDGDRIFPHSFGMVRGLEPTGRFLSNPFPLRPSQAKQGKLAQLVDGKIIIQASSIDRVLTNITLEEADYVVTVAAYSELDGAQCRKRLRLTRTGTKLDIFEA